MNIKSLKYFFVASVLSLSCGSTVHGADHLLVVGDATWGGWSLDRTSVMIKNSDDVFSYTGYLEADKEFKFLTEAQWDKTEYRNASTDPYILGAGKLQLNGADQKFKVRENANYSITCNLNDMTVVVEKAPWQAQPIYHNMLYLVGDATPGGWALADAIPLHQSASDPFLFSGDARLSQGGIFKIATNCYADYNEQKFFFRDKDDSSKISTDATDDR